MREPGLDELRRWVDCWKRAAPDLAAERRARLRVMDTAAEVAKLSGGDVGLSWKRPDNGRGLVEQQRIFARWPR